jgi:oligopeptidase A
MVAQKPQNADKSFEETPIWNNLKGNRMNIVNNPLMQWEGLPRFDLIKPEHFTPALKETFKQVSEKIDELESNIIPTWEGLCKPLEDLDLPLERTWGILAHLISVKNCKGLRDAQDECMADFVKLMLKMSQSKPIYQGLKAIQNSEEYKSYNSAKKRIIDAKLQVAEQSGIALEGDKKVKFNELFNRLSVLGSKFSNNVLDSTKEFGLVIKDPKEAEGWPKALKYISSQAYNDKMETQESTPESGPWRVTLDHPSFLPFMQNCKNRELRKTVYHAFSNRATEGETNNIPIITEVLQIKKEIAELLGYENYAQMSLDTKMAKNIENVYKMYDELEGKTREFAQKEHEEVQALAKENGFDGELMQWDIPFWSERLREKLFDYTEDQIRPYFPFSQALEGLFALCERLFAIKIKKSELEVPKWHDDVDFFDIFDEKGKAIAHFYLDPYSRPHEKRGGAWMNICSSRRIYNGKVINPVIYIECNGTPPVGTTPSLMSFYEVNTLFHEFGHGLQGMLTTVDESEASGVNGIEWDAVELASQFMENWCVNKPTMTKMAIHYKSGEVIPDELFEKLKAAKTFRAAFQMQRQIAFGKTDLYLHSAYDPSGKETVFDVYQKIASETCALKPYPEDRFLCAFSHIFAGGYAAGYYSYKWAEVLSADAFAAFEEVGLDNEEEVQKMGKKYRDTILALGGSLHPEEVYIKFRGRPANTEALLRHSFEKN